MEFRVNRFVKLRNEPRDDAPNPLGIVDRNQIISIIEERGEWRRVLVEDESGNTRREGFIKSAFLIEREAVTPRGEEIDEVRFVSSLTFAARSFGVNRDYLAAVAWLESRFKNKVNTNSGATGPFQFLPSTWAALVREFGDREGISLRDIAHPGKQGIFAAILTAEATEGLLAKLGRLPTAAELYLAHMLGRPAAQSVLSGDREQPIDNSLLTFYRNRADAEAFVDKIIVGNSGLLKAGDAIKTTQEVVETVVDRLNQGLHQAARIAALLPEHERFTPAVAGEEGAPWMVVARRELAAGVVEDKRPGRSSPRIEEYLTATLLGPSFIKDDTAWCAAFVSFCMAECGNEAVKRENTRSARAADWLAWGNKDAVTEPPIGAVTVLEASTPGNSGHVGFLTGIDATHITLLAGNQTDENGNESVNEKRFSRNRVRAYRWLDVPVL